MAESFPVVLVDEAQDLKPERLRMISAMTQSITVLIAADEFQCLDQALRPNPCVAWLRATCKPEVLIRIHRTEVPALLLAAEAVRTGMPVQPGPRFNILPGKGLPMAAAYLANAIAWRGGGNVAVITPSLRGTFARDVVTRVSRQTCGNHRNGPYAIRWDRPVEDEVAENLARFRLSGTATVAEAIAALGGLPASGSVRETIGWVLRRARVTGATSFSWAEVSAILARRVSMRRQRMGADGVHLAAMTVHQAKNREFEGIVVLWPFEVGGNAEHKRRLLYNAITRARRWCTVIVQGEGLLSAPPFA